MQNPIKRLGFIIILVILLPTLFFSVYEISNTNKNEKVIESIYKNQLEAILFSVNQYTEDLLRIWSDKIGLILNLDTSKEKNIVSFLKENRQINSITLISLEKEHTYLTWSVDTNHFSGIQISHILEQNKIKIKRLKTYLEAGYKKIEPTEGQLINNSVALLFLTDNGKSLCILEINPGKYIREILGPKMQLTAEDKFIISAINKENKTVIYNSENLDTLKQNNWLTKEIWLLPGFEFGIELKGNTIQQLVKSRTQTNLLLLLALDIILILGGFLVFRNVQKEVKLAQIKSEFISNVSHEIRTPLALISMYIETLELGRVQSDEKIQEYYRVISEETARLSGIVNKILNFSKIESGKRTYKFEESDINKIIENVLTIYNFHFSNKGFEIKVDLNKELPGIHVDKESVSEAVVNLLDNAVKYSRDEKYIEIKTGLKNKNIYIEVTDRGIGISKEHQKHIFDKFYRVTDGNLAYQTKGSGLGLAIVKSILNAHGGNIEVESMPGKGSTFRLFFPVVL